MVHPYLRRREGRETADLSDAGAQAGAREDARRAAVPGAGDEGGDRRRRVHAVRSRPAPALHGDLQVHRRASAPSSDKLVDGMVANGYPRDFAERTFKQLEGFGSYGFPESHAASFAKIAYASSWMKCHHPDVFLRRDPERPADGLLRAGAARRATPSSTASRCGRSTSTARTGTARWSDIGNSPTASRSGSGCAWSKVWRMRTRPASSRRAARRPSPPSRICGGARGSRAARSSALAKADAFGSLDLGRRRRRVGDRRLERGAAAAVRGGRRARRERCRPEFDEPAIALAPMTQGREVVEDYRSAGLSLRRHPVAFLRADLDRDGILRCADLRRPAQRAAGHGRGARARAPEAGLGQGRHVHHDRG